jgi:hypothetical protein
MMVDEEAVPPAHDEEMLAAVSDVLDVKCCRICLESDRVEDMIAPCRCKGSSKWIHRTCLDQWRAYNADDVAFSRCMECRFEFQFEATKKQSSIVRHGRHLHYWLLVSRDILVVTFAVQAFILLVAFLFWCALRNEDGVVEWTDDDFNPVCTSSGCQFWSCLAVGLLVLFLLLGVYGSILLCTNNCNVGHSIRSAQLGGSGRVSRSTNNRRSSSGDCCSNCATAGCGDCACFDSGDPVVAGFLLIILAMVGIVLAVVGFVLASIVAVAVVQLIARRHLWVLQKKHLIQEYRVRDLSNDPGALFETNASPALAETTPTAPTRRKLEEDEIGRLRKLGLMEE